MPHVNEYYAPLAAANYKDNPEYYQSPWTPTGDASNHIRLWPVLRGLAARGITDVYEVGVGDGYTVDLLQEKHYRVLGGCDTSPEMLAACKRHWRGQRDAEFRLGDIEDATTLPRIRWDARPGHKNAVLCLGPLPHVLDDERTFLNLRMLAPAGTVYYLEMRNVLFSLFTLNRHTRDFVRDELLRGVPYEVRQGLAKEYSERCNMQAPPQDPVRKKFHNPLTLPELCAKTGFSAPKISYYHAHATLPWLGTADDPEIKAAMVSLERPQDWRSMFLCSAFIAEVEAL